jgi:hypothetical protein
MSIISAPHHNLPANFYPFHKKRVCQEALYNYVMPRLLPDNLASLGAGVILHTLKASVAVFITCHSFLDQLKKQKQ